MPLNLVVSGATGRMGGTLHRLIDDDPELEWIGGIDRDETRAGFPAWWVWTGRQISSRRRTS